MGFEGSAFERDYENQCYKLQILPGITGNAFNTGRYEQYYILLFWNPNTKIVIRQSALRRKAINSSV